MFFLEKTQLAWQNLSDANRSLWVGVTNFLQARQRRSASGLLSAHQLFIKYNCIRQWSGLDILLTPAFSSIPFVDPEPYLYLDGADIYLMLQSGVYYDGVYNLMKITPKLRPSIVNFQRYLRVFNTVSDDAQDFKVNNTMLQFNGAIPEIGDTFGISLTQFSIVSPDIKSVALYRVTVVAGSH